VALAATQRTGPGQGTDDVDGKMRLLQAAGQEGLSPSSPPSPSPLFLFLRVAPLAAQLTVVLEVADDIQSGKVPLLGQHILSFSFYHFLSFSYFSFSL
jgi:hypothetical protein